MTLPAAVQKQRDAAEAAQKRLAGNPDGDSPAPLAVDDQPKQPQQEAPKPDKAEPAAQEQAPKPDNREDDPAYWRNRFNVLQGKYDKEVPALTSKVKALSQQIEDLTKAPPTPKEYITKDELEEYGDIGPLVERIATRIADDRTKPLEETAQKTSRSIFFQDLDKLAIGWRETNVDDGFNDWLDEMEPMSGRQRRDLLNDAFNGGDVERTAAFFNAWGGANKQADALKPAADKGPAPLPDSTSSEMVLDPERVRFTPAQIKQFYTDKATGKYAGREEEAKAIERQIFQSQ